MGEPIEQRGGHLGVAEDASPFAEAEIGGDDHAGMLVEPAEQVEEQGATRGTERQVTKLIEDDEITVSQATGDLTGSPLHFLLLERIDQFNGREEADAFLMMLDGLHADGSGDVGLAGSRSTDQNDVVGLLEEVAAMELTDQRFVDLAA